MRTGPSSSCPPSLSKRHEHRLPLGLRAILKLVELVKLRKHSDASLAIDFKGPNIIKFQMNQQVGLRVNSIEFGCLRKGYEISILMHIYGIYKRY